MKPRIVVVGSSNTDMILQMERIPRPGETVLGGEFAMAAGGKGANQAVAAARAGGAVTLIARVGKDLFGEQAVQGFQRDKINVDYVFPTKNTPSGVALIFVAKDGENSIAVASGANRRLTPGDIQKARDAITAAQVLLVQLETPLETVQAAVKLAQAAGVRVILNPAPACNLPDDLLARLWVITPNETEAELLTGVRVANDQQAVKAAGILLAKGIQNVVITLGARGAIAAHATARQRIPAFPVKPVDTTAAGDIFNGALAVALAEGKSLFDAVRFANAAGALSTTRLGAQPSAPKRGEILKTCASR